MLSMLCYLDSDTGAAGLEMRYKIPVKICLIRIPSGRGSLIHLQTQKRVWVKCLGIKQLPPKGRRHRDKFTGTVHTSTQTCRCVCVLHLTTFSPRFKHLRSRMDPGHPHTTLPAPFLPSPFQTEALLLTFLSQAPTASMQETSTRCGDQETDTEPKSAAAVSALGLASLYSGSAVRHVCEPC